MIMNSTKILGAWSGHDCAYAVLENGRPLIHDEYERFIREKEPAGDSVQFFFDTQENIDDIKYLATCEPFSKMKSQYPESYERIRSIIEKNEGQEFVVGHHQAHAANAFFSSNFKESMIVTVDGGGIEGADQGFMQSALTFWYGKDNKIHHIKTFPLHQVNIGGLWTRSTRYIFKLQSGWPYGHQAGSVMAMASFGDPNKYHDDFYKMLTTDIQASSMKPSNQPRGPYTGNDPIHPYLDKWSKIADQNEEEKFNVAAGLQSATERYFQQILQSIVSICQTNGWNTDNLCLSGGVSLNSVMTGKIWDWFPQIKGIYITPTPHDGGLPIGAAQYTWHHILNNPRIHWNDNFTPYLGRNYFYEEIGKDIRKHLDDIETSTASLDDIVDLLMEQKIVAVFHSGSESGRRALGNRSILADPRNPNMKDLINEKVKHRQWFRPFAPSIIRENVKDWFVRDLDSPYMGFVVRFKDEVLDKVPAVVHVDKTARLQTVTKNDNIWYYNFLKSWEQKSGVPIILNTSFNDREPICETPHHAIDCFLRTNIDYLYFVEEKQLLRKKNK